MRCRQTGIAQSDYVVVERDYYFVAPDGSVFVIELPRNLWGIGPMIWNPERKYIAGPRKGESEEISWATFEKYRAEAEAEWGRFIPGTLFGQNHFKSGRGSEKRCRFMIWTTGWWGGLMRTASTVILGGSIPGTGSGSFDESDLSFFCKG